MTYLSEIAEREARGTVAEAYHDIRHTLQVPFVSLIYRHLAATTGGVDAVWKAIRPNLLDPAIDDLAAQLSAIRLGDVTPVPRSALAATGTGIRELRLVRLTLAAYEHANSRNLLMLSALLQGSNGAAPSSRNGQRHTCPPTTLLPMADLRVIAPATRLLLEEMTRALTGNAPPLLIPSLLRHFANNSSLLALIWTALQPTVAQGAISPLATVAQERAIRLTDSLPHPVRRLPRGVERVVLERFVYVSATMLVVGAAIGEAVEL